MTLIPVTSRKHGTHYAQIDDADYALVSPHRWSLHIGYSGVKYALAHIWKDGKRLTVYLHQLIIGHLPGSAKDIEIDHWDGDGLNNQRYNLRLATHAQNAANCKRHSDKASSRYKGVYPHWNKWTVYIKSNYKLLYVGVYDTEREAALAYDAKARELFGEFARTNF